MFKNKALIENNILIIPDSQANLTKLTDVLGRAGFGWRILAKGKTALLELKANPASMILVELNSTGSDNLEVCRDLKKNTLRREIPILFVYDTGNEAVKIKGFRAGCADFISRPFVPEEVLARVRTHLKQKLNSGLALLNEAAVRFNNIKSGLELYADSVRLLKNMTGGMTATLSTYNPADKCLHVKHAEVEHTIVNDLFLAMGRRRVTEIGFPISEKMYNEMAKCPIWYYYTVHEATFGVIPNAVGKVLQRIQDIERFLGIAFFFDNELFGASMVAFRSNVPDPPVEIIQSYAQMVAMALRRIRAEEQERKSEEKYRNIFNNAVEGIYQTTIKGRLHRSNPSFARMFGYRSPEEMTASVASMGGQVYANPEDRKRLLELLKKSDGLVRNFEVEVIHKQGSRFWVSVNARMMQTDDGAPRFIEGTCIDISERKTAEEEIRKLNENLEQRVLERTKQLEEANKELEAFSYTVSHDLRTPVRALNGYANMINEDYGQVLDHEGKRLLSVIAENATKMGRLIDDLLAFSRLGRQEMSVTKIDMTAMARSVFLELCQEKDPEKIQFRLQEIPMAFGDPSLLRQVWVNLIGNAIKYSSRKPVQIIEIGCSVSENESVFYVKDNGAGFNMAYAAKLFGVFQRLHSDKDFEGTGVGLAIVQRIIHRLNGRVWAEGKVGEGATFFFTLGR